MFGGYIVHQNFYILLTGNITEYIVIYILRNFLVLMIYGFIVRKWLRIY